jgi:hypothetical protein
MAMRSKDSSSRWARRSERRTPLDVIIAGLLLAACIAVALGLASCNNPLEEDDPTLHIRVANLVSDSPTLRFKIDDADMSTTGFEGVTDFHAARPGTHTVGFEAIRPLELVDDDNDEDDEPIPVGTPVNQEFQGNIDYTVFAYGKLNDIRAFVMATPDQREAVETDDHLIWQVVHAASGAPAVDIYLTAPDAKITTPQRVASLNFSEHTDSMDVQLFPRDGQLDDETLIGEFTIEIRALGTSDVLYRSGEIPVTEKQRLLLAIVPNTDSGPATLKLMRVDTSAGSFSDPRDNAEVRFVHVSPDSPTLDVIRAGVQRQELAKNIPFRDVSAYVQIAGGETDVIATPTADPSTFLFLEEFNAFVHSSFSVYAVGPAADVDGLIVQDRRHSAPTQARFRFLHAAASLDDEDALDIYVTPPGQVLDFDADDDEDESDDAVTFRKFTSVGFPSATEYLTLEQGNYEVHFAAAGTSRVLVDSAPFTVANGDVTTYVLHESETATLELLPVDDSKPAS